MVNPNDLKNELDDFATMNIYLTENIEKLPALLGIQYLNELLIFSEKIKPIYAMAVAICGDITE